MTHFPPHKTTRRAVSLNHPAPNSLIRRSAFSLIRRSAFSLIRFLAYAPRNVAPNCFSTCLMMRWRNFATSPSSSGLPGDW